MHKTTSLSFLLVFVFSWTYAQNNLIINSEGIPPITNYTGEDFGGLDNVWDIVQSEAGFMYVGTTTSLLEFDGESWRTLSGDGRRIPRMFAKNEEGRIYIAGHNMVGYLAPNKLGQMDFHSINHLLPENREVGILEYVWVLNGKVFFNGLNSMYVFDESNETLQVFEEQRMYPSFVFKEKLYHLTKKKGLHVYENDTISPVKHGDYFIDIGVSEVLAYDANYALAISRNHDFHFFDGDTAYQVDYYYGAKMKDKLAYKFFKLTDKYNAICYLKGGLIVTDNNWQPVLHLDESVGYPNEVHSAYLDKENNLWVATSEGISIIELGASYSIFDKRSGISGVVNDMERDEFFLHVATTKGVYSKSILKPDSGFSSGNLKFTKAQNSDIYNDDLVSKGKATLVRAYKSSGQIQNGVYEPLFHGSSNFSEIALLYDSTWALTIGTGGQALSLFTILEDEWTFSHVLENDVLPKIIYNLRFDPKANKLWGSNGEIFFSFSLSANMKSIENYRTFGQDDGLPKDSYVYTQSTNDQLLFSTNDGVYKYDYKSGKFLKPENLNGYFNKAGLYKVFPKNDTVLIYSTYQGEIGEMKVLSDTAIFTPFVVKALMPSNSLPVMYLKEAGTFVGASNYIGFIQDGKVENYDFVFQPHIRQVDLISGKDSTVFHGLFIDQESTSSYLQKEVFQLEPSQNAMRFSYAIPYYRHPKKRHYSCRLVGFEESWSEWSEKTQKEYTNLSPGRYTFKVKARNGFSVESKEGVFQFVIFENWYQTIWAYFVYSILFLGFLYLLLKWNSKRLRQENLKLEQVVAERTSEIRDQKETIEKSLSERESLLKEIHHRVKNNLQIIASLLYLQSGKFEDEDFKRVLEEGQGRVRSMALIHQKLYENDDLKSIPFGEYLQELLSEIKASFGSEMASVQINIASDDIQFDVETAIPLGLIVNELATNSFKYAFDKDTDRSFSISLKKTGEQFILHISDNGKGIPEEIDIKKTKSLGLRLVKMLSVQLEGDYEFTSTGGTHFSLKFAA